MTKQKVVGRERFGGMRASGKGERRRRAEKEGGIVSARLRTWQSYAPEQNGEIDPIWLARGAEGELVSPSAHGEVHNREEQAERPE